MNTLLQTPAPNLERSLEFYDKLNFTVVTRQIPTLVADSDLVLQLNTDRFARPGLVLYSDKWDSAVEALHSQAYVLAQPFGHLLADPSGMWIYLKDGPSPLKGMNLDSSRSVLGNFAGICLESLEPERSLKIYETLGFKKEQGEAEQGWVTCKNEDGLSISIMGPNSCPHIFINPSLTYFNGGKNLPVIEAIRQAGIPFAEEITHFNEQGIVDNVVLRDPGGLGMFIFND